MTTTYFPLHTELLISVVTPPLKFQFFFDLNTTVPKAVTSYWKNLDLDHDLKINTPSFIQEITHPVEP